MIALLFGRCPVNRVSYHRMMLPANPWARLSEASEYVLPEDDTVLRMLSATRNKLALTCCQFVFTATLETRRLSCELSKEFATRLQDGVKPASEFPSHPKLIELRNIAVAKLARW
jgi:hypothetical protein